MLPKLFKKSTQSQHKEQEKYIDLRIDLHYGIPSTSSILAYDPVQRLLAIGTLDGRIKVLGGNNIEGLLIAPKPFPFKNIEFLQNQGLLVSVSNENEIQVWDLESRLLVSSLKWESNITCFSIIYGTHYMYIGDEYGYVSTVKYDKEEGKIVPLLYNIPANLIAESAEIPLANYQSVVGLLPQPCSSGNRVLIAYDNGFIILWDVTEDRAVLVRGSKDLQLIDKCLVDCPNDVGRDQLDTSSSDCEQMEKEISSLCWVSPNGSVLAVGYVDGDILLWNLSVPDNRKDQTAKKSSSDVVKLQLASGERRLPVIVLHWSPNNSGKECKGKLYVYGGDQIGSDEVLTVLSLDWSSGIANLKCICRVDLPLSGSFADMTLLQNAHEADRKENTSLFILTNPGQLQFYDTDCLSGLRTEPEKQHSLHGLQYPAVVPAIEPCMTVGKLFSLHEKVKFSRASLKTVSVVNSQAAQDLIKENSQWPLSGGVPSQLSLDEDKEIERIYVTGYQDGSVRIFDATCPILSPMIVFGAGEGSAEVAGAAASVSALDLSATLILTVGNECGLVFLYRLDECSDKTSFYTITEAKHEVTTLEIGKSHCVAIFSLLSSPVRMFQYLSSGDRIAVAYESGQVAVLDFGSLSVLFLSESVQGPAIISLFTKTVVDFLDYHLDQSQNKTLEESPEVIFLLRKDAHIVLMDSTTGNQIQTLKMLPSGEITALSMIIIEDDSSSIEGHKDCLPSPSSTQGTESGSTLDKGNHPHQSNPVEAKDSTNLNMDKKVPDSLLLLCCEKALYLYPLESVIQGMYNFTLKVELAHPCTWTTILKEDGKACGLIIVYQSGVLELRSLPDLKVMGQTPLMSILRWNFKTNMEKTMSCSERGLITMVNGSELAFVSLLASENESRLPEALPCLHDKALETVGDFLGYQKEDQDRPSGPFAKIIKGFKGVKPEQHVNSNESRDNLLAHLESILSRSPFSDLSFDFELDIDDIEVEEPASVPASHVTYNEKMAKETEIPYQTKETEREKLFEGGSSDSKPKMRTRDEIVAKYRHNGDVAAVASQAKEKLLERQEKLEQLGMRTAELQDGAENFADMAKELAKKMEKRRWWHI
ncbi:membrane trafficking regulatory protein [Lithospermum erythrorhizon]|uniref:Membrane trafficking regulatory protein n=1 Tax=Lithospermum erythrorhizon TaxID=34254 RepID=A0AAV3NNQ4_LITER